MLVGRDALTHALAKLGRLLNFTVTVVDPFLRLAELPEADRISTRWIFRCCRSQMNVLRGGESGPV